MSAGLSLISSTMKRVAIIGAGAAGLCAARHAAAAAENVEEVVVFEQTAQLGGTWIYTEMIGKDANGLPLHSSMYRDMKTNLPKEVMGFPGFPFPDEEQSFIHRSRVLRYIEAYARHYQLERYIRFETVVESVTPAANGENAASLWEVCSRNVKSGTAHTELFDAVFVCNGHYFDPIIPDIEGSESFPGRILHSHEYRSNESFANERVVSLGAGPSGIDISLEIAAVAAKVYLCHEHEPLDSPFPDNLIQKRGLKRIAGSTVHLLNDEILENISTIVLCTGYHYRFPFLRDVQLMTVNNRVTPLFQHMVHIDHPRSLFFIGLNFTVLPFTLFDVQLRYAFALLTGKVDPPDRQQMLDWERCDFHHRTTDLGLRPKFAHFLGPTQWKYFASLASLGHFPNPVVPAIEALFDAVHCARIHDLPGYKELRYRLVDDETYRQL